MKTAERHQLKTNEVAEQVARVSAWLSGRGRRLGWAVAAVLAVAVLAGAAWAWRARAQERATTALGEAIAVAQAPIVPPDAGAPPSTGTFMTEQARREAAVKKFLDVVQQYPSTAAGRTARFQAASLLAAMGRTPEAEQHYRQVMADDQGLHGRAARLGLAELQVAAGKHDEAIATYRDLIARKDGDLPVDGLLMQLGRVYELAGKRTEAMQTYQRVVSEFPQSIYLAEARRAADTLKTGSAS